MAGQKIYTAYENAELKEPCDRVVLVREGFAIWAWIFTVFWLLSERLWLAAFGYVLLAVLVTKLGEQLGLSPISMGIIQFFVQLMLGFTAYDLKRLSLRRQGFRFVGVVVAETPLHAERRYYDMMGQASL